jgi:7-cyano-7-deazaguanine reductase
MEIPEFTCLCPKTGQPDFATLILDYIPEKTCVELKSLKLYIWSFRDEGCFHEAVTNRILDDLVKATQTPLHARDRASSTCAAASSPMSLPNTAKGLETGPSVDSPVSNHPIQHARLRP